MGATYQPPQWLVPNMGPGNINKVGNYSFNFDGTGEVITLPSSVDLGVNSTISYWTNFTSPNVFIGEGSYGSDYMVYSDGANTYYRIGNFVATFTGVAPATGQWHHIVFVRTGDDVEMYLNNVSQGTENPTSSWGATTTKFDAIGAKPNGANDIVGSMSEIVAFNYVLDATGTDSVETLYGDATNGVGNPMGFASPPVAYYKGDRAGFGDQWAVPNQVNYDQAFNCGPSAEYIDCGNGSDLDITGNGSISFWLKAAVLANYDGIVSKAPATGSITTDCQYDVEVYSSKIRAVITGTDLKSGGETWGTCPDITVGTWEHFVVTWDGTNLNIYKNGVIAAYKTLVSPNPVSNTDAVLIGRRLSAYDYDGDISNVAIWDSALSGPNILTIYNNGTPLQTLAEFPSSGDVQAWWKLDQSATFGGTNWSIPDDSTNSNTGISSGMTQANLVPATLARSSSDSNYSFNFDGVGDEIALSSAYTTTDQFTVSIWANSTAPFPAGTDYGYYFGDGGLGIGLQESASGSYGQGIIYIWTGAADALTTTAVTAGVWEHLVFVCDKTVGSNGEINFYRNGVLDTTTTLASADLNSFTSIEYMGTHGSSWNYTGNLSNMSIWSSALSAANITTLYNNGKPGDLSSFSPTAVGWWKLGDDAFATAAAPTAWTVPDQISTNDGTSAGNPTISGEAPGSTANGLSVNMDIEDRIGESGQSNYNGQSYNMAKTTRTAYT